MIDFASLPVIYYRHNVEYKTVSASSWNTITSINVSQGKWLFMLSAKADTHFDQTTDNGWGQVSLREGTNNIVTIFQYRGPEATKIPGPIGSSVAEHNAFETDVNKTLKLEGSGPANIGFNNLTLVGIRIG